MLGNVTGAVSRFHEVWSQLGETNSREATLISRIDSVPKKGGLVPYKEVAVETNLNSDSSSTSYSGVRETGEDHDPQPLGVDGPGALRRARTSWREGIERQVEWFEHYEKRWKGRRQGGEEQPDVSSQLTPEGTEMS